MEKFERRVIVTGLGLSDIGRHLGRGGLDLALDAALGAIVDAGLQRADIDGVASMPFGDRPPEEVVDALGLQFELDGRRQLGCAAGCRHERGHGRRVRPLPPRPGVSLGGGPRGPVGQRLGGAPRAGWPVGVARPVP